MIASNRSGVPVIVFASPRQLPKADRLPGRVVVLDLAFAAHGMGTPFEKTTLPFIDALGERLAAWVDHHDHEQHRSFADDPRFHLTTKQRAGACPEMVTPEMVERVGPVGCIVTHNDLDGLYAAAKWLLGGKEPYPGADRDARAVDTRVGPCSARGRELDHALRVAGRDDRLRLAIVDYLVGGLTDEAVGRAITEAAHRFAPRYEESQRLALQYHLDGRVAVVDAAAKRCPYDKTELLLLGQQLAPVAIVQDAGTITIAAPFESGLDFVELLSLGGGMPTRVSLPATRLREVLDALNRHIPEPTPPA